MSMHAVTHDGEPCLHRLLAIQLLAEPATVQDFSERARAVSFALPPATALAVLRGLRVDGLVRASGPVGAGRRVYRLTAKGRRAARAFRRLCQRWRRSVEATLAGEGGESTPEHLAGEQARLAEMRQDLERQRSDFLSTVSHELRTPLTLIRTSVGLLLDSQPDPEMRERLLRNVKHSADRMNALVNDLLDLARLNSGKADLQLRYIDVVEVVSSTVALMSALLEEKAQRLRMKVTLSRPRVMADHRRIEQVLLNLLSNANKFAPRGALIEVRVERRGAEVVVCVADSGPGIPPEAQVRLFEQFYTDRTSSPSHNIGAGLGLPIAKGLVEAHGGRMWVVSSVGAGSKFYFSLPVEGPAKDERDEDTDR